MRVVILRKLQRLLKPFPGTSAFWQYSHKCVSCRISSGSEYSHHAAWVATMCLSSEEALRFVRCELPRVRTPRSHESGLGGLQVVGLTRENGLILVPQLIVTLSKVIVGSATISHTPAH